MLQPLHHQPTNQPNLTHINSRSSIQAWWETVRGECDWFFEISTGLDTRTPDVHRAAVLLDLQVTRNYIEAITYPPDVNEARGHLLNALNGVISGVICAIKGEADGTRQNLQLSHDSLALFNASLDYLGVD